MAVRLGQGWAGPSMNATPKSLRQLINGPSVLTLPGVFDGISARLAGEQFDAIYMTGFGVVASAFGLADVGTATYTEMVDRVRCIARSVKVPLLADGDTGYGGALNVVRTVRGYIAAGAAGIQIEDQEFPKKCGHTTGRRVIATEEAARKIKIAAAARDDGDFVIVARTDARTAHGLDEALRRAEQFVTAGADVLFVESPETIEEMRRIGETFRGVPLLANMVEGGRTPCVSADELKSLGFTIRLCPVTGLLAAAVALRTAYRELRQSNDVARISCPLLPFSDMTTLMGFAEVAEFEKRWA